MNMGKCIRMWAFLFVITLFSFMLIVNLADRPLYAADVWDKMKEQYHLQMLPGEGRFIESQRGSDTKDADFPLEVISDGYKMVQVYQDLMDSYIVEWAWRATVKNSTKKDIMFSLEYKLQDEDSFLITSSKEQFKKIAPGEILSIEKTDSMPYERAKRVKSSKLDIQLQK